MSDASTHPANPDPPKGPSGTALGYAALEPVYSRFAFLPPSFGPTPAIPRPAIPAAPTHPLALIAPHVDPGFYLAGLGNDPEAARDPVSHYHTIGWKQGRSPNPDFDTRYYLRTNQDVSAAGVDPLLHYLRFGHDEGRPPQRPGGARRALAEAATPPATRPPGHHAPPAAVALDVQGIAAMIRTACVGKRGLVVALSHDRYIDTTGGMQIFIADEQAQFNGDRIAYLHLAPVITRLLLAREDGEPLPLQLTLDGTVRGLAFSHEIIAAIAALDEASVAYRLLVVHSLFGHRCSDIARLSAALRPLRNFFWLHDYSSLCSGYNLLRNDVSFCGAPPESSMACRICVYGEDRATYRATIASLFDAVAFDVMAPAESPARIWRDAAHDLPCRSIRVHPNALLRQGQIGPAQSGPADSGPADSGPVKSGPVRVAFIGYPIPAKGWMLFLELIRRGRGRADLAFYHFANAEALRPMAGLVGVPVRVDSDHRRAMADAVAAANIDLVAMLAPWPETFSYVTREALAGGADVVALAESGAVADAVREYTRGVVLPNETDVLRFFLEGHAGAYVERQRAAGRQTGTLLACGTTATFDPVSPVLDPTRLVTRDPALVVIAGDLVIAGDRVIPGAPDGAGLRYDLPPGTDRVRLLSRHIVPARLDPDGDVRKLGIAVTALALDGEPVPIGDPRRSIGWHGGIAADGLQWTNGDATVEVASGRSLTLVLADAIAYQRCKLIPED